MPYEDIRLVLRYTRRWIFYGWAVHAIGCTVIAAITGLLRN
jgi:hypothetical protein